MQPAITLGLDGSPESLAAARWAADEAAVRPWGTGQAPVFRRPYMEPD